MHHFMLVIMCSFVAAWSLQEQSQILSSAQSNAKITKILEDWAHRSASWEKVEFSFIEYLAKPNPFDEHPRTGRLVFAKGGPVLVQLDSHDQNGKPIASERHLYTTNEYKFLEFASKKCDVYPIPKNQQGRIPSAFALPLFWNVSVGRVMKIYHVTLAKEDSQSWMLKFIPRDGSSNSFFEEAIIKLNKETYLPEFCHYRWKWASSAWYRVADVRVNKPISEKLTQLPAEDEWKIIHHEKPMKFPNWLSRSDHTRLLEIVFEPELLP